jgi:hypothetical protein
MQDARAAAKMGVDEVATLSETVKEQEDILNNVDKLGSEYLQDRDNLQRTVNRGKRILQHDAALVLTGKARDEAVKELKRLKDLILVDMPTQTEMNAKLGSNEADEAVRKNLYFHRKQRLG